MADYGADGRLCESYRDPVYRLIVGHKEYHQKTKAKQQSSPLCAVSYYR